MAYHSSRLPTFAHFLIQFVKRWFNQFPSFRRGFPTTTYFRHLFRSQMVLENVVSNSLEIVFLLWWKAAHGISVPPLPCINDCRLHLRSCMSVSWTPPIAIVFSLKAPAMMILRTCKHL